MVYVTGDMHGDESRFFSKQIKKLDKGDTLIVCGDLGLYSDGSRRKKTARLSWKPQICRGLCGRHAVRSSDLLKRYRMTVWNGGRVHRISGNLFHLMRGQIFTIEGLRIFAFGGGESLDREMRDEHKTWWREEMPSPAKWPKARISSTKTTARWMSSSPMSRRRGSKSALLQRSGDPDRVNKLNGYFEQLNRECKFRHSVLWQHARGPCGDPRPYGGVLQTCCPSDKIHIAPGSRIHDSKKESAMKPCQPKIAAGLESTDDFAGILASALAGEEDIANLLFQNVLSPGADAHKMEFSGVEFHRCRLNGSLFDKASFCGRAVLRLRFDRMQLFGRLFQPVRIHLLQVGGGQPDGSDAASKPSGALFLSIRQF